MRNGKHYVPVRMTKSEKEYFLRLSELCHAPEKTVLYWLVNDMVVYEKPPEIFFKISKLMRRLETNVDHIWLGRSNLKAMKPLPESCKNKRCLSLWHTGKARDCREEARKHSLTRISGARRQYKRFCLSRNTAAM